MLDVDKPRKRIALTLRLDDEIGKQDRANASAGRSDAGSRGQGPRRDAPRREQQSASSGGGALADALRRAAEKNAGNGKSR